MKARKTTVKKLSLLAIAIVVLALLVGTVMVVTAVENDQQVDEMDEIKKAFVNYRVQDTVSGSDNYVGDYQYTVYFNTADGTKKVTSGYNGTPVIVYTVNTGAKRIGTKSNTEIIGSMIDRGYAVIVLDYLNSEAAISPALDLSAQQFRLELVNGYGKILTNTDVFSSGKYNANHLVPSGYDVLLNKVFWEIDKHSADGTFEKIVENWNSDFRSTKGGNLVYWMHEDGITRKSVQNDFNGNAPVWYDADGNVDANGKYTYVKFTKAEVITDCVNPDGSFIDMDLRMHIIYPTSPNNKVPVIAMASSSGYPSYSPTSDGGDESLRPHSAGALFNGYAFAVFDYLWQPMGRSDSYGYYDGAQGVSNDHMNYSLHIYNDKLVNTAAMRYIRYTSLSGGETYNFDIDKIGVIGNSKGGWFNFLGEKVVQSPLVDATEYATSEEYEHAISLALESFVSERTYNGYHGATRYSAGGERAAGFTSDGITIEEGVKQPWLTYDGKEIISGCQLTLPENGGSAIDITEGHVPIYVTSNMGDYLNAHYGVTLDIYNTCKTMDLPLLHLELPIGHTFPYGKDINYNVDSYDIFQRFVNYYLQNKPVSVAYVTPMDNAGGVSATEKITVVFVGQAELSEVSKITVTAANGTAIGGTWESSFGGVMWTFTPDMLSGSTEYTVSIPAGFAGTNGTPMAEAYTSSFITEFGAQTAPDSVSENVYTFKAPEFTDGNRFVFRFNVTNDAANVAEVYANSADGEKLGSVNLRGKGSYEIDITDYVASKDAGEEIKLVLKAARTAGDTEVKSNTLSGDLSPVEGTDRSADGDVKINTTNVTFAFGSEIGNRVALRASLDKAYNYTYSKYYNNPTKILTYYNVTGGDAVTKDDLGRLYTFKIDIYDTVDRVVQLRLRSMTDKTGHQTIDYDNVRLNVKTQAGQWATYTFTYRVYEPDYGTMSQGKIQYMDVLASPDGNTASPIYLSNLVVTENVTEINVSGAVIAEKREGRGDYSAPASATPFAIYNGETCVGEYATWSETLAAYTSGYTIKLQKNYTFTAAEVSDKLASFAEVNLDLGAYTLRLANTSNSLLWIKATNKTRTDITVSGGSILIGDTPVISYGSASTSGSGKTVSISFNSVDIGLDEGSMATQLISASNLTSGVALESVISFNDCTFNLPDAKRAYDGATVFPESDAVGLDLSYEICGGSMAMTSEKWLTVIEDVNSVSFKKDTNGDYTTLVMPKSYTYPLQGSYFSENGYVSYAAASEENNLVTYEFAVSENSTIYGVIPDSYADSATYPFVLFKDGACVSGHKTFTSVVSAANELMTGAGCENETAQILLRTDHTATNTKATSYNSARGTIIFDLGGHTLTRSENAIGTVVLNSTTNTYYETDIIYKNGRVETPKGVMFATQFIASNSETKTFNFTFENVTFGSSEGATALNNSFWTEWSASEYPASTIITNITLRDCTIDLYNNKPSLDEVATLFDFNTSRAVFNLVIEGGKIIGDGTNVKLAVVDSKDTLTLAPNENGEYLKFVPKDGGTAPNIANFAFDDGKYRTFILDETSGEYLLSEGGVETPYGTIPATYANAQTYPFAIFKYNSSANKYEFINHSSLTAESLKTWKNATGWIDDYATSDSSKVVLLVRRDYANSSSDYSNDTALNAAKGTVTIDLGGNTLTRGATIFSFYMNNSNNAANECNVIIKNGTLLTKKGQIFYSQISVAAEKVFNVQIEDVTLGFAEGAESGTNMFWSNTVAKTAGKNGEMTLNIEFNNCTFDLLTNNPGNTPTLFKFKDTNNIFHHKVSIKGGEIICEDLSALTLYTLDAGNDTVTFEADGNGEYAKLVRSSTAKDYTHHNKAYPMADGNGYFVEISDDGITSVYELTSLKTSYGTGSTTAKYLSAVDYPFYIFQGGEFVSAEATWKDAMSSAKGLVEGESATDLSAEIVMRRDYDIYKATEGSVTFNTARGTVILDLGGYRITTVDGYFIDIAINNETASHLGYESRFVVRNGELLNVRATLPSIGIGHSKKSPDGNKKTLTFTFENVTFRTTGYSVIRDWGHSGTTGLNVNLTLDGCTYNFNYATSDPVMFYFKSGNAKVVTNVNIIGGKIVASKLERFTLINYNSEDRVVYSKDTDGNYTALLQPTKNTTVTPNDTFINANGLELTFVEVGTEGGNTLYRLISKKPENIEFVPKSSITLGSELVYNIYVPAADYLNSYTVDGATVENAELVTIGDIEYYLIKVSLPAKEAARNIILKATVTVDGRDHTGTWTMSVPKYAKKIIDSNASEEEVTLVKDVLAYIRAAYVYFDAEGKDEALATIDEILGAYSSTFKKVSGETDTAEGLKSVTIVLEAKPVVRFVLPEGKTAENYTFSFGGRTLEYKTGAVTVGETEHIYVELELYAYQLIGEIEYTDGTYSGSFHINSYYDFVTTDEDYKDNANLITLVEKLYNYASSAESYRASVAGN